MRGSDDSGEVTIGIRPIETSSYRLGVLFECMGEGLNGIFLGLRWRGCRCLCRGRVSRSTDIGPGRTIRGKESAWGVAPDAKSICRREVGNGWYGMFFIILGLLRLLTTEEGYLAFCGGFGEISTIRLFVASRGSILVLFFGLFRLLPCRVAHVTTVSVVTIRLRFPEFVVGKLARRGRWRGIVRMCGSSGCAKLYGVCWAPIDSMALW